MAKKQNAPFTLGDLDARAKGETPHEFEILGTRKNPTGLWISVYGSNSETFVNRLCEIEDETRTAALRRAQTIAKAGGDPKSDPFINEITYSQKLASARVAGWRRPGETEGLTPEQIARFRGLDADFTPANVAALIGGNTLIQEQATKQSEDLANFLEL